MESAKSWDIYYGVDDDSSLRNVQFVRLHAAPVEIPEDGVHATVMVIHGGFWKNKFGLDDEYGNAGTASLAPFFRDRGYAALELEYRRRDHLGGGWPGTNEDVLAAVKKLRELQNNLSGAALSEDDDTSGRVAALRALRLDRLILAGHSAGGCMALWAAHQFSAAEMAEVGKVALVYAAAPVADLIEGYNMKVSDEGDAVELYMKCTPEENDGQLQYQKASPASMLPLTFPILVAYGDKDADLPPELVAKYVKAATEKSPEHVHEVRLPEADHFDVVNAKSAAWVDSIIPSMCKVVESQLGAPAAKALKQTSS